MSPTRKKLTKAAETKRQVRVSKARGGILKTAGSRCVWCKEPIPEHETARTFETPPDQMPLPAGCAWVICGEDCSALPSGAQVFYRVPIEHRKEGKRRR